MRCLRLDGCVSDVLDMPHERLTGVGEIVNDREIVDGRLIRRRPFLRRTIHGALGGRTIAGLATSWRGLRLTPAGRTTPSRRGRSRVGCLRRPRRRCGCCPTPTGEVRVEVLEGRQVPHLVHDRTLRQHEDDGREEAGALPEAPVFVGEAVDLRRHVLAAITSQIARG